MGNKTTWRRFWALAALLLTAAAIAAGCTRPRPGGRTPATAATVRRVLVISVDGLRPDVLLRADAPNIRHLCRQGAFTFWAQTVTPSLTVASHVSMMTGLTPEKHGVWFNYDWSGETPEPPQVPTLFEVAKNAGYTTALVTGKAKFNVLNKPGSLDWSFIPEVYAQDLQVAGQAARVIGEHRPQVMLVHFPGVDAAGHGSGWGSEEQIKAVHQADLALAVVLSALRRTGLIDTTVIILTADHGGTGNRHWQSDLPSRHIPWIIAGPTIRRNLDLTQYQDLTVNTYDTFAMVCHLMNIPLPEGTEGKPILQAIRRDELLYDAEGAGN